MIVSRLSSSPYRIARKIQKSPMQLYLGRTKSSIAATSIDLTDDDEMRSITKNPIPDFDDARTTFESKSTRELLRAATCFQICKIPLLVENAENLIHASRKLLGGTIVDAALKATFFGHFCAGEDQERIQPVIKKLKDAGVGSILDFAAEDDGSVEGINNDEPKDKWRDSTTITAREYDYESEAQCDQHVSNFLECINDVKTGTNGGKDIGYAAIKVTALGNPKLLARLSTAIVEAKRLFSVFDRDGDGLISREEFEFGYNRFFVDGNVRIKDIFEEFDPLETGYIDYITWSMMLSPQDLPETIKSCKTAGILYDACPSNEEIELLNAMFDRGQRLAEEASKSGVRLLIDAEQVRHQPAIDNLVLGLQRQFNVGDVPIIYNTYQCYLRDSFERLRTDVARSERFGYHFGAKIVRGAYMESERELAKLMNIEDPIHPTIEHTHQCYDDVVNYLLQHSSKSDLNVEIMCATHNQESILRAIESMNSYGIDRRASTICFAQLFGMSDQLTFNLGRNDYRTYKYLPYGEVAQVIPYLLRRARENSAVVSGATEELNLVGAELKRRFITLRPL